MAIPELSLIAHLVTKSGEWLFFTDKGQQISPLLTSRGTMFFRDATSKESWAEEAFWTGPRSPLPAQPALRDAVAVFSCPLAEIPAAAIDQLTKHGACEIIYAAPQGWRCLNLQSSIRTNVALFSDALGTGLTRLLRASTGAARKLVLKKYGVDLHAAGVGEYKQENGHVFLAQVPELERFGDSNEGNRDAVLFFEETTLLSPHHAHADIREKGGGRYSLWKDTFYFSSTDGSDPNHNGRRYRYVRVDQLNQAARKLLPNKSCLELTAAAHSNSFALGSKAITPPSVTGGFVEFIRKNITRQEPRGYLKRGTVSDEIALFITNLGAGGAERQMSYVASCLKEQGRAVRVLTYAQTAPETLHYKPVLERQGIPVQFINHPHEQFSLQQFASPEGVEMLALIHSMPSTFKDEVYSLFTHLMVHRPKILHCWLDHSNVIGAIAGWLAGVPKIVLSSRSVNPTHFPHIIKDWYQQWYSIVASNPRVAWVANSTVGGKSYAEWIGIPFERFKVVHNGLDLRSIAIPTPRACAAFRENIGIPLDAPVLTAVFRMSHEKRPLRFVRLVYEAKKRFPNLHAIIAGTGPLENQVRNEIDNLQMGGYLHLVGRRDDVPLIMGSSNVVTLLSTVEGLPNVLIEAQWLSRPVVTTKVGNVTDIVQDGRTGYVCSRDSFAELLDRTIDLLGNPQRAAEFGEAGHLWTKQHFSLERMISEMTAAYGLEAELQPVESLVA